MNKKIILVALIILALTLGCRFSIGLPTVSSTPVPVTVLPTLPPASQNSGPLPTVPPVVESPLQPILPLLEGDLAKRDAELTALYQRVNPGVVTIYTNTGLGTGFVYDIGYVVTNDHVIDGANYMEVHFASGFKATAEVVGADLDSDLAVLKVNAPSTEFVPLKLGDSDALMPGQTVVAIGNPFGYAGTMTVGILSAKGRTLSSLRQAEDQRFFSAGDVLQTDASINPGNSGGPLLNLKGEVIGVNRAIETTSTTPQGDPVNTGIGFAVSSNIVKRVVPFLIKDGKFDYPYLGLSARPQLTLEMVKKFNLKSQTGAYVLSVTAGGPAEKAGITAAGQSGAGGDLIIKVDGQPVLTFGDMLSYLMKFKSPGDQVVLTVLRGNDQKDITVTLGKRP